jgi:hypothetical protein
MLAMRGDTVSAVYQPHYQTGAKGGKAAQSPQRKTG